MLTRSEPLGWFGCLLDGKTDPNGLHYMRNPYYDSALRLWSLNSTSRRRLLDFGPKALDALLAPNAKQLDSLLRALEDAVTQRDGRQNRRA